MKDRNRDSLKMMGCRNHPFVVGVDGSSTLCDVT
jgi:hypothetical protein